MGQEFRQSVEVDPVSHTGRIGMSGDQAPGGYPLQDRIHGRNDHKRPLARATRQSAQGAHALADNLRLGRNPVIGQAVPGRQTQLRQIGRKEGQRIAERHGPRIIARNMKPWPARLLGQGRQEMPIEAFRRARNGRPPPYRAEQAAGSGPEIHQQSDGELRSQQARILE